MREVIKGEVIDSSDPKYSADIFDRRYVYVYV